MMKLVHCTPEYWEFVRILRNDVRVQDGFIQSTPISPEMQKEYMGKQAENFRIALIDDKPAGYVGVIDDDIRVCTHPDYQGQGLGKFMIEECMKLFPKAMAKIKVDNQASLKLFESCGFKTKYFILSKE